MAKPKKDGGPKQKLSPIARRKKAIRDKKFAMTAERKAKKAELSESVENSRLSLKVKTGIIRIRGGKRQNRTEVTTDRGLKKKVVKNTR